MSTPLPLDRAWIEAHLPHRGRMCLLDAVVACDEWRIRCVSGSHASADNPLRSAGRLGAACGVEYAAQAMAAHAAVLLERAGAAPGALRAAPGALASVRNLELRVERLDDVAGPLEIECTRLTADGEAALYDFALSSRGITLLLGRAAVVIGSAAGAP